MSHFFLTIQCQGSSEGRVNKNTMKFPTVVIFEYDFFLFWHLLNCCSFFTSFQSSCKIFLVSQQLFIQCFCLGIKAWSFLSTQFLKCNLRYCGRNTMTSHLHQLLHVCLILQLGSLQAKKALQQSKTISQCITLNRAIQIARIFILSTDTYSKK